MPNPARFFFMGLGYCLVLWVQWIDPGSHEEVASGLVVEGECPALGELVK